MIMQTLIHGQTFVLSDQNVSQKRNGLLSDGEQGCIRWVTSALLYDITGKPPDDIGLSVWGISIHLFPVSEEETIGQPTKPSQMRRSQNHRQV
jgi:hypothetical protein